MKKLLLRQEHKQTCQEPAGGFNKFSKEQCDVLLKEKKILSNYKFPSAKKVYHCVLQTAISKIPRVVKVYQRMKSNISLGGFVKAWPVDDTFLQHKSGWVFEVLRSQDDNPSGK